MSSNAEKPDTGLYVGYLPAPKAHARFAAGTAITLVGLFMLLSVVLAGNQDDPGRGTWDASGGGVFEGTLRVDPYPLLVTRDEHGKTIEAVLVDQGKHWATPRATPFDGQRVRIKGGIIRWGVRAAIEFAGVPDDVAPVTADADNRASTDKTQTSTTTTLIGEIVDPKCYLGVMNPGHGKPHLSCAELCIRGGIPPVLAVRSLAGDAGDCVLLVTPNGGTANELVRGHIGRPVRIEGERTPSRTPGGWDRLRVARIVDL